MKTNIVFLAAAVLMSQCLFTVPCGAEVIEGKILDVNLSMKTFQMVPAETGEVTEDHVFAVRPDTVIRRGDLFREIEPGDKVRVEATKINGVLWKVHVIAAKS